MVPWGQIIAYIVQHAGNIAKGAAKAGMAKNKKGRRAGASEAIMGGLIPVDTSGLFSGDKGRAVEQTPAGKIETGEMDQADEFNKSKLAETYYNRLKVLSENEKGVQGMDLSDPALGGKIGTEEVERLRKLKEEEEEEEY